MKIGKKLHTLTHREYLHLLANYKKFVDFNHLGLFRSILENPKLSLPQQLEVRDAAIQEFAKFFEFLQLKDPATYFSLTTLGQVLTVADSSQAWDDIKLNQQRLLLAKKLNHRNFGTYSKHNCGYKTCYANGVMARQGSRLAEGEIYFHTDKNKYAAQDKSERRRRDRKQQQQLVAQELMDDATLTLDRML